MDSSIIPMSISAVRALASSQIKAIEATRARKQEEYITKFTTQRRWFGWIRPYTREEVLSNIEQLERENPAGYYMFPWVGYCSKQYYICTELLRACDDAEGDTIYVSRQDYYYL